MRLLLNTLFALSVLVLGTELLAIVQFGFTGDSFIQIKDPAQIAVLVFGSFGALAIVGIWGDNQPDL